MDFLLLSAAFLSGVLNGIGSSGGMLFFSVMLLNGYHPVIATSTNKVITLFGSLGTIKNYWRSSEKLKSLKKLLIYSAIGSILGSVILLMMKESVLGFIYIFLTGLLILLIFKPDISKKIKLIKNKKSIGIISGFYNGFFGPGTVIITTMQLNLYNKKTKSENLATATIVNTITNAVACFVLGSSLLTIFNLDIRLLLALIVFNFSGQYFGSLFIVKVGEKYISVISKITLIVLFITLFDKYIL